jgi:hypothetical protein
MNANAEISKSVWEKMNSPLGYILGILVITGLIVAGIKFFRIIPQGLINFNNGTNQGWIVDGFYDGDQPGVIQQANNVALWIGYTDVSSQPGTDDIKDNKGSIAAVLGPNVPESNIALSGYWRFDFISPDLSSNSDWQKINGVELCITDNFSLTGNTPLNIQVLLKAIKPDGSTTYLHEVDSKGEPVFITTDAKLVKNWNIITSKIKVSSGYTVQNLYVRVFGIAPGPNQGISIYFEGYIAIDAINPIH